MKTIPKKIRNENFQRSESQKIQWFVPQKFLKTICFLIIVSGSVMQGFAQYNVGGNAVSLGGNCFRLTAATTNQVGSVWFQNKISLASDLTVQGTLYLGNNDGGADGIAFVLQPICSGIGAAGGGIGYQGITPSLAIEFDTWQNASDPAQDHIAVQKNGNLNHTSANNLVSPIIMSNLEDNANHTYKIEWIASSKTLKLTFDGSQKFSYTNDIVANIFSNNRNVFWGFTGATGAAYNVQSVCISSATYTEEGSYTATDASCPNYNNGAIDLNPAGGISPFTYLWSNSATTEDVSGLSPGTYNVTVTDGNGCKSKFSIVVGKALDTEDPVIHNCPSDITVDNDPGRCGATVNWTSPTASDNCGATLTSDFNSGDYFDVGTTWVTYTATDAANNSVTCSFAVTVRDTMRPAIQCPLNVNVSNDNGLCGARVSWDIPQVWENCNSSNYNLSSNYNSGDYFPVGTTTVTYTATDLSNNSSSCSFDVTVNDTEKPVLTACPNDMSVGNDNGVCGAKVSWTAPTASDNCGATLSSNYNPGDYFPVGTTTVTYTAIDAANNSVSCSFDVTVNDTEKPVLTGCPNDMSVSNDNGVCGAKVSWTAPTASDNCGATLSSNYNSGDYFPVGTTTVTYTAVDAANNSVSCSFDVTVNDDEDPVASCKGATVTLSGGSASIVAADVDNGSSDNCGIASVSVSPTTFSCSDIGNQTVVLTVTDIHNNVSTCNATVTVVGSVPSCTLAASVQTISFGYGSQTSTITATPSGGSSFTYSWTGSNLSGSGSSVVFSPSSTGTYTIQCTVTNEFGCSSSCTVKVCVWDVRDPKNSNKVLLCHVPPGNTGNPQTLSISASAVPSHLSNHSGDAVGPCGKSCGTMSKRSVSYSNLLTTGGLELIYSPNPFQNSFKLTFESDLSSTATVQIYNMAGSLVETATLNGNFNEVELGEKLATGVYNVKFTQGDYSKNFRVIKAKN